MVHSNKYLNRFPELNTSPCPSGRQAQSGTVCGIDGLCWAGYSCVNNTKCCISGECISKVAAPGVKSCNSQYVCTSGNCCTPSGTVPYCCILGSSDTCVPTQRVGYYCSGGTNYCAGTGYDTPACSPACAQSCCSYAGLAYCCTSGFKCWQGVCCLNSSPSQCVPSLMSEMYTQQPDKIPLINITRLDADPMCILKMCTGTWRTTSTMSNTTGSTKTKLYNDGIYYLCIMLPWM